MKWKKYSAMVIMLGIGFLLSSRVVFAKPSSAYYLDPKTVLGQNNEKYQVYEYKPDSSVNINHPETGENTHKFEDHDVFKDASGKLWLYDSDSKKWNEFVPVVPDVPSTSGSSASNPASVPVPVPVEEIELRGGGITESPEKIMADLISMAETVSLQNRAAEDGFSEIADMYSAAERGLTAGEYYNNAVMTTPGIENATPVAQGGNLVVNGEVTNMTAIVSKADIAFVDSVRAVAEGTVLNVVDIRFPALTASIEFYMPGVASDADIAALQYENGTWVEAAVETVRADHVTVHAKNGKLAFIAK